MQSTGGWLSYQIPPVKKTKPAPRKQPPTVRKPAPKPQPKTSTRSKPAPTRKPAPKPKSAPARKPPAPRKPAHVRSITPRQKQAAARASKIDQKKAAYVTALKGYRVRKADKGRIIFIDPKGKVVPRSYKKKAYAVYVPKTGKKKSIRAYKEPQWRDKVPHPLKPTSVKLTNFRQKKAVKKAIDESLSKPSGKPIGPLATGTIDETQWLNISSRMADVLQGIFEQSTAPNLSLFVEMMVAVKRPDGRMQTIPISDFFHRSSDQRKLMDAGFFKPFVAERMYWNLARDLDGLNLVTAGSAAFVKRLKENKGKQRDQWTKRGRPWGKADHQTVKILFVEYRITEQPIKSK